MSGFSASTLHYIFDEEIEITETKQSNRTNQYHKSYCRNEQSYSIRTLQQHHY